MRTHLLLAGAACLFLAACDPFAKTVAVETPLPDGLKDCQFFQVKPYTDGPTLNIVRCPLSTTSVQYPVGKSQEHTVTTEADTSAKVDEIVKRIDAEIARLEELKKGLK